MARQADARATRVRVNVTFRSNGICFKLHALDAEERDVHVPDWEIVRRIAYWDRLELSRACPLRFSGLAHRSENLTTRQKLQLEQYLDPGPVRHLWPDDSDGQFEPFLATHVEQPFFEERINE